MQTNTPIIQGLEEISFVYTTLDLIGYLKIINVFQRNENNDIII